jgi:hypothetical protein
MIRPFDELVDLKFKKEVATTKVSLYSISGLKALNRTASPIEDI